jgi:V/A-type H+-transporting ATPase subunit C
MKARYKKTNTWNYAFAIGKIRALEKFLITNEVFEEAIDADLGEALKLFMESDLYGEELLDIRNAQELEQILAKELLKVKKLIQGLLLDKKLAYLLEMDNLAEAKKLVRSYNNEFLSDYIMHAIDMHNIKTFLRLRILKEPQARLKENLTEEGFIKKDFFLSLYDQDILVFLSGLEYVRKRQSMVDYAYFLKEPIQKLEKDNSFVSLEKAIQDYMIQILKPAKYLSSGPEPLLAYYFAKVNEINLMRMIILAKLNQLDTAAVKERLNSVYA